MRNEQATLPKLAASIKKFLDKGGEWISVDTGSSDNSCEVARSLGCKVHAVGDRFRTTIDEDLAKKINDHFGDEIVKAGESLFDYSAARNYAASLASNDVVCMPDSDEAFTKYDLAKIEEAIANGAEQLEYNFVFSHDQFGKEAIKFLHCKFYNRTKLQWTGIIHEVLTGEAKKVFLDESICKLEHFQNRNTDRKGYLTGLALDCYLHPENDRNSHYLAREMLYRGFYEAAIQEFERHIKMNKWVQERGQSMIYIGDCYLEISKKGGNVEFFEGKAVDAWHKALSIDCSRREAFMRLAEFYRRKDDFQRTACYASAALTIPNGNFYANSQDHYAQAPHELLYWAFWYLGDREQATVHFYKALEYQPRNPKFLADQIFFPKHPEAPKLRSEMNWNANGLPKVTFVIPTLGRPDGLKRCLESIKNIAYPQDHIEILTYDGEGTVPEKLHRGYIESTGQYIVLGANDVEFTSDCLQKVLVASRALNKALVAFHEGPVGEDEGNINTHFIIRKDFVPHIGGEIFDRRYYHIGADNLLWAKAKKLNQAYHCSDAKIEHYHYSTGKSEFDEVYAKGWAPERVAHDRELLKQDLEKLNATL